MSRYIQRNENGKIVGDYACEQDFAKEIMEEDHPEFIEYTTDFGVYIGIKKIVEIKSEGPTEI